MKDPVSPTPIIPLITCPYRGNQNGLHLLLGPAPLLFPIRLHRVIIQYPRGLENHQNSWQFQLLQISTTVTLVPHIDTLLMSSTTQGPHIGQNTMIGVHLTTTMRMTVANAPDDPPYDLALLPFTAICLMTITGVLLALLHEDDRTHRRPIARLHIVLMSLHPIIDCQVVSTHVPRLTQHQDSRMVLTPSTSAA